MTGAELLLESIRAFLDGRTPAVEFAVDFNHLYDTKAGSDPVQLWVAFEELAIVAFRFSNECEAQDWEGEPDAGPMRVSAQTVYETATDIIRRRGLHNIR